jgi:CubicO group peptidase (beta-lactamase class C family)
MESAIVDERSTALSAEIDAALSAALADGVFSAAVAEVAVDGDVVASVVVGDKARYSDDGHPIAPESLEPADADTRFDLASVTKVFSAFTLLSLVQDGLLELDAPIARWLPDYASGEKARVTLRHLLTHTSGLPAVWEGWREPLGRHIRAIGPDAPSWREFPLGVRDELIADLLATPLVAAPGTRWEYSCAGFNTAMALAERATGERWSDLVSTRALGPAHADATTFTPDPGSVAATEYQPAFGRGVIRGIVHDEASWSLGGASANAGLFGTARDLLRLGERIRTGLTPVSSDAMWSDQLAGILAGERPPFGSSLGLRIGESSWMGDSGTRARGHTGFTGTSVQIDRDAGLTIALLTNRVHPSRDGEGTHALRTAIADAAYRHASPMGLEEFPLR